MRNKYLGSVLLSILLVTSLTASASIAILTSISPPVSAAGNWVIENCVPDLGQHSKNWCWVAAAANSMYWYSQHGYLQLIDNFAAPPDNDNKYIKTMIQHPPPPPPPPGPQDTVYDLLQEIAKICLYPGMPGITIDNTWDKGIFNNQYFFGLQNFINQQGEGAALTVHEIVDNNSLAPNVPPQNDNIVIYGLPTLDNYENKILENRAVLLWLSYRNENYDNYPLRYEDTDHVVTGVGFSTDNTLITVSDPWTTGSPDHGNDLFHAPENHPYDNLQVLSSAPLIVRYPGGAAGGPVPVIGLIYISPATPAAPVDNFKRENMPDLGQHCENWCWTAAASNIFKWYYHNGYPKVVDDPKDNVLDENYLQLLPAPPTDHLHDNLLRLLHEIAKDCLYPNVAEENENTILLINTFCHPIDDNKYFYGLQKFIREQGGQFKVREIIDNSHFGGLAENIPPENDNVVIYDQPTFDNYKNWLKLGGVLLQENFRNYSYEVSGLEALDHIITGVSYFDGGPGNQWMQVSDSWTPLPGPDHNDNENLYTYENLQVISDDPLTVMYTGYTPGGPMTVPVQIVNLILISPENVPTTPCTGTASLRLATSQLSAPFLFGIYKAYVNASLTVYTGDNLHLKFLAQDNRTVEWDNVIWSRTAPGTQTVTITNLVVPHDNSLVGLGHPNDYIKRMKLVLTDSAGTVILDNMAWYRVVQDDWGDRISWVVINWALHTLSDQDKLGDEISTCVLGWALMPFSPRDQHDFSA